MLNPLGCSNTPVVRRAPAIPASGSILPFPPANTSIRNQADGVLGGTGCLYTGPDDDHAARRHRQDERDEPEDAVDERGLRARARNLEPAGERRDLRAERAERGTDPNHSSCSGSACNGDVNVSGTLNGQLTIASQDDIIITGNLTYHQYPGGTDVLGLVADNDVAVVHASRRRTSTGRPHDRRRDHVAQPLVLRAELGDGRQRRVLGAHPCAVAGVHSLIVNGVITQEFRGPVGTFTGTPPTLVDRLQQGLHATTPGSST